MELIGKGIFLRLLSPKDVTLRYVKWMKDQEVIAFLECRWNVFTLGDLKEYVRRTNKSNDNFLFGIFLKDKKAHIGNIKIGNVNKIHKFADLGLIIGQKEEWGKGYATEAIQLATKYAFEKLNLNKLIAGIYVNNTGSYKAFLRAGYKEIGRMKKHRFYNDEFVDEILVEKFKTKGLISFIS